MTLPAPHISRVQGEHTYWIVSTEWSPLTIAHVFDLDATLAFASGITGLTGTIESTQQTGVILAALLPSNNRVVLIPRYEGASLTYPIESVVHVRVCALRCAASISRQLTTEDVRIVANAELHPSLDSAVRSIATWRHNDGSWNSTW
jgi:hypothetical protein